MIHLQQTRIQAQNIIWKTTTQNHGQKKIYKTHKNCKVE
jgi:hypothetical protein